jgi:two-component system alkaline phosphatase synthesis response regulator PhoP
MPLQRILTETRQRFVTTFPAQYDSIRILVDQVALFGPRGPVAALAHLAHRMAGLGGTIGFPTISARASDLESLIHRPDGGSFDAVLGRGAVDALREAFDKDFANPPDWAIPAAPAAPQAAKILIAEDEPDQRAIVTDCLEAAGYATIAVVSGDLVIDAARAEKPALILLDIAMPRLDGYSACRRLKADPELAGIPVIFITAGATLDDRLAGLALGADEFLTKPVDMRELILRIQLVIGRCRSRQTPVAGDSGVPRELTYDAFVAVATEEIGRSPAAFAMVRLPTDRHGEVAILLAQELRGRDAIGAYDLTRMLILMPEMTAAAARDRLEPLVVRLTAHGLTGICMGVTAAQDIGSKSAETLIGEADEALAEARYLGHNVATWTARLGLSPAVPAARTVVVAEDDPDVTRIVDAQLRAAGYKVFVAFDGEAALMAARAQAADVLVLDLMMPKLDGFEVLRRLREGPAPRPRVIVLSGRGREPDVMRAFELGADDYMTKPFNPQELMARIARVLK